MENTQKLRSTILMIGGALLIGFVGFAGLDIWQSKTHPRVDDKKTTRCTDSIALSVAQKNHLQPVQKCRVEQFVANTNEKIAQVIITFGSSPECRAQCHRDNKIYYVKDNQELIYAVKTPFRQLTFSLGSEDKSCSYAWTNDLGYMVKTTPDHIKQSLIKEGNEYRWRFELTDFSGQSSTDPNPPKCLRTGVQTTNLELEDIRIVGSPKIEIR